MKFDMTIFRKSVSNIQISLNVTRIMGTSHEDRYTFLIISRSVVL